MITMHIDVFMAVQLGIIAVTTIIVGTGVYYLAQKERK